MDVYAGAQNTVRVDLDKDAWGKGKVELTGTFADRDHVTVVLPAPDDARQRMLAYGEPQRDFSAGRHEVTLIGTASFGEPSARARPPAAPGWLGYRGNCLSPTLNAFAHDISFKPDGTQLCRVSLQGTCRVQGGIRRATCASDDPGKLSPFEPKSVEGLWPAGPGGVAGGPPEARFDDVLVARAVGPDGEGLPWVKGCIVDYADDAVAREVREISRRWDYHKPVKSAADANYDNMLRELDRHYDADLMRTVLGVDTFNAFNTDAQRLWYAQQGAWYDTSRYVNGERQGYIVQKHPYLQAGGLYVLYLWSNSRDDRYPDARVVFRADKDRVADLGAIHLPTYND